MSDRPSPTPEARTLAERLREIVRVNLLDDREVDALTEAIAALEALGGERGQDPFARGDLKPPPPDDDLGDGQESVVVENDDLLAFVREAYGADAEDQFAGVLVDGKPGFREAVRRSLTNELVSHSRQLAVAEAIQMGCQCEACQVRPHASGCAVHNMPAHPNGPCDCRLLASTTSAERSPAPVSCPSCVRLESQLEALKAENERLRS